MLDGIRDGTGCLPKCIYLLSEIAFPRVNTTESITDCPQRHLRTNGAPAPNNTCAELSPIKTYFVNCRVDHFELMFSHASISTWKIQSPFDLKGEKWPSFRFSELYNGVIKSIIKVYQLVGNQNTQRRIEDEAKISEKLIFIKICVRFSTDQ